MPVEQYGKTLYTAGEIRAMGMTPEGAEPRSTDRIDRGPDQTDTALMPAGPTQLSVAPQPPVNGWTPERVQSLYTQVHATPNADPQIIEIVDAAHELYQNGLPSLPLEIADVLDALEIEIQQPQTPEFVAPEPAAGLPQYYGMTTEQWNTLEPWQQNAMYALGTGSIGEKAGSFFGQMVERYPWLNTAGEWLDAAARFTKRTLGTVAMGVEAAKPGGPTFGDFITDIEDAWAAAEQAYRVMPTSLIASAQGAPMEAWDFGTPVEREIPKEQQGVAALMEYWERLNAGETVEALNAEYEQRYGFQGMMRDLAGMMVFDPLNFMGSFVAKGAGAGLKQSLKVAGVAPDVARPLVAAVSKADGPIQAIKRLKGAAMQVGLSADEWAEMPSVIRALASPYDGAGALKILNTDKGILNGMFRLTPEARAREWFGVLDRNMTVVMDKMQLDPVQMEKFLTTYVKNKPDAIAMTSMKALGSAEWAALDLAIKDRAGEWIDMLRRYNDPLMATVRDNFKGLANALGRKTDELIKDLKHPTEAAANARRMLQQAGTDLFKTEDELLSAGKYFGSAEGALDNRQIMGALKYRMLDDGGKWAATHFNITEQGKLNKFFNLIKNAQGLALLDLSAPYYLQNAIDAKLKLMREGMLIGPARLMRGKTERIAERLFGGVDLTPGTLRAGIGAEAGQRGVDAISAAVRGSGGGMLDKANEAVSGLRGTVKKGLKAVGVDAFDADSINRFQGAMMHIAKNFNNNWRAGKGFSRLSAEVEQVLGNDLTRRFYSIIENSRNQAEIEAGIAKLLTGKITLGPDELIDDVIRSYGYNPGVMKHDLAALGIDDFLLDNLTPDADQATIARVFTQDLPAHIAKKKDEWHKLDVKLRAEAAAQAAQVEGRLGTFSLLDEAMQMREDQRFTDIRRLDNVYKFQSTDAFDAVYGSYVKTAAGDYKRLSEKIQSMYDGVLKAFGADDAAATAVKDFIQRDFDNWGGFFDEKHRLVSDFLKKQKKGAFDRVGWEALQDRLDEMYDVRFRESLAIQAERDAHLIDAIVMHYGPDMRPVAQAWADGVRKIDAELYDRMQNFRRHLRTLPDAEARTEAWQKFWPEHKKVLTDRTTANMEGARSLHVKAKQAQRTQVAPKNTNVYSREEWIARVGLPPEQRTALDRSLQMFEQAGVPIIKDGKPDTHHLLGIVNSKKHIAAGETPEKYRYLWDVPEDVLASRLEAWRAAHPDAQPIQPGAYGAAAAPAPDPIGIAPPGTVAGLQPMPIAAGMDELFGQDIEPFLSRLMDHYLNAPRQVEFGKLSAEQIRAIKSGAAAASGELSEFKNAASKFAQISTDAAMLDYTRRMGFDDVLGAVMPYQFWYTRSAMNWALTAIDRPAWYAQYHRLRETQDKLAQPQEGFPQRLAGKMQIPIPFIPESWGMTAYIEPWHNVFGFEAQVAQIMRPLIRDNMNRESRAEYILAEMARSGEITEQEMAQAIESKTGELWERAIQQAAADVEAEIATPLDLVGTMFSYSLPIQWALENLGLASKSKMGGGVGTYPSVSTIQNLTAFVTPGGVNVVEKIQQLLGAAQEEQSPNARGYLWDYYVARELSNMAALGADVEAVKLAMVEKSGPLYQQAVSTVGKMQAVRGFASVLWLDFFPEGEIEQRKLAPVFQQYADAGKMTEFFEKYPEYEARLLRNNWDDPEKMMASFLRGSIWDAYYKLDKPSQRAAREQLGAQFERDFIDKETRNYDALSVETLASWARQLNGVVPENAPATPQAEIEFPSEAVSAAYAGYEQMNQQHPGYALLNAMYSLPEGMRDGYKAAHPEIAAYEDAKAIYLTQNPDLIPYVIGPDSRLAGISEQAQIEVYAYYAERATYFPGIKNIEAGFYQLSSKGAKAAYLRQFPQLRTYWDWNEEAVSKLSTQAFTHVKGETGMRKLRQGKDYKPEYRVDTTAINADATLKSLILTTTMTGRPLGNGAQAALKQLYSRERPPVVWDEWLAMVLEQYTWIAQ